MNIQIFGTRKSFDTKKAERYFKERSIKYISPEDKPAKILENQKVLKVPIVRNGKQATVGYQPDIWKNWK